MCKCGRTLWDLCRIHMLFQGVEFSTVNPATSPTTRIPSKPHILPLSFPLLLFLSLPVSCMHIFMQLHSLASDLYRTQTRSACVAGANWPPGLLLHRWNRLSCLSLHFSFFQSVPSVRLCCALLSQSSRLIISIV